MTRSAEADGSLQIMYGVGGEHDLSEHELPHLRGWKDSRPVRMGNGAWDQTQLDVYGELLDAAYVYRERGGMLQPEFQLFLGGLADTAARRRSEPDSGMWQMRGHSNTTCHHSSSAGLRWTERSSSVQRNSKRTAVTTSGPSRETRSGPPSWSADEAIAAARSHNRSTPANSMHPRCPCRSWGSSGGRPSRSVNDRNDRG